MPLFNRGGTRNIYAMRKHRCMPQTLLAKEGNSATVASNSLHSLSDSDRNRGSSISAISGFESQCGSNSNAFQKSIPK